MSIDEMKKMNFAELIAYLGTSQKTAMKDFLLAFQDDLSDFKTVTYEQFYQKGIEYGNLIDFEKRKSQKGPQAPFKVGVMMENCPEFLYIQAGCSFTNSTLVALNTLRSGTGLANDIDFTDVDLLFTDKSLVNTVLSASSAFTRLSVEDTLLVGSNLTSQRIETVNQRLTTCPSVKEFRPQKLATNSTAMIIFTSGTTGAPKGIEITWKKLMDVGFNSVRALNYTSDDVGYICTPLCHSNAMYLNFLPAMISGAKVGLRNRFRASKFVSDITCCQATVWNCVGKPVTYVLNTIKNNDYTKLPLRTVISTGTTAEEQKRFSEVFGLDLFIEAYGSTETGAVTVKTKNDEPLSVGKRNPAKPFLILGENTDVNGLRQELGVGEVGEIAVNNLSLGDSAFQGYYRDPESTRQKFYVHQDKQTYYLTGDLGRIDSEDHLFFMGRTGEWYRKKGENRSEASAEDFLSGFKDIITIAAFGMPDATSQEDYLVVVIETNNPDTFDIQRFMDFANQGDKGTAPHFVRLVTAMPKTATSKIIKNRVKQLHIKRRSADVDVIYDTRAKEICVLDDNGYQVLIDSYLPQSKERLNTFMDRLSTNV